jgi:hypothetical protein
MWDSRARREPWLSTAEPRQREGPVRHLFLDADGGPSPGSGVAHHPGDLGGDGPVRWMPPQSDPGETRGMMLCWHAFWRLFDD